MEEAFLNTLCPADFIAESAGLEPGILNPLVVEAMNEEGIDISHKGTQGVSDVFKSGRMFAHVISLCDAASAEKCPIFPGICQRHEWSFPAPSALTGSREEQLQCVRAIRDMIRVKVTLWCSERCSSEHASRL